MGRRSPHRGHSWAGANLHRLLAQFWGLGNQIPDHSRLLAAQPQSTVRNGKIGWIRHYGKAPEVCWFRLNTPGFLGLLVVWAVS